VLFGRYLPIISSGVPSLFNRALKQTFTFLEKHLHMLTDAPNSGIFIHSKVGFKIIVNRVVELVKTGLLMIILNPALSIEELGTRF
jgi:hypothetical protein